MRREPRSGVAVTVHTRVMESLQPPADHENSTLTVITIFENEAAARRAERTVARLIDGIDGDAIVLQQRWSYRDFEDAEFGADGWLGDADVILVAGARDQELPAMVMDVIERELAPGVEHPTALVALGIVPTTDGSSPSRLFGSLEALSRQLGMRFFSSTAKLPPDQWS
jgi:hypothetical protein